MISVHPKNDKKHFLEILKIFRNLHSNKFFKFLSAPIDDPVLKIVCESSSLLEFNIKAQEPLFSAEIKL
jgi:hypothetical protein